MTVLWRVCSFRKKDGRKIILEEALYHREAIKYVENAKTLIPKYKLWIELM